MTDILGGNLLSGGKGCNHGCNHGGMDDSLLFFFLLLVMISCGGSIFGGKKC